METPQFTQVKETCLYIADIPRTKAFYHGRLGLPLIGEVEGRHVFFRAGRSVLLCFIAASTKAETKLPPHHGSGHLHFAFECRVEDYECWKQHVREQEIPIEQEVDWPNGLQSFYFRDPDDHLVEIVMKGLWGQ